MKEYKGKSVEVGISVENVDSTQRYEHALSFSTLVLKMQTPVHKGT
jgi:hypothetical protein